MWVFFLLLVLCCPPLPAITGASQKTRDAVSLISTVDSVGIYSNIAIVTIYNCGHACQSRLCVPVKIVTPAAGSYSPTDATNCTGAVYTSPSITPPLRRSQRVGASPV